jgi:hypothetical protein
MEKNTPGGQWMTRDCKIARSRRAGPRLALVALVLALAPASLLAGDQTIAGHGHGQIATPVKPLEIDVVFSAAKDRAWEGQISIPAQGTKDLPLEKIESKDGEVGFEIKDVPGNPLFKGKLEEQGKQAPATLLPDRDDGFNVKEQSGTSIRFITDSGGKVSELALSNAAGIFSAKRKNP